MFVKVVDVETGGRGLQGIFNHVHAAVEHLPRLKLMARGVNLLSLLYTA